jgi:hypothetical protein
VLITMFAVAAATVTAAPVSAEADNVAVAGYGRLATGASAGVNAVSTPLDVSGRLPAGVRAEGYLASMAPLPVCDRLSCLLVSKRTAIVHMPAPLLEGFGWPQKTWKSAQCQQSQEP